MTSHNTCTLNSLTLTFTTGHHDPVTALTLEQLIPDLINLAVVVLDIVALGPSEVRSSMVHPAKLCSRVGALKLCPDFLHQNDPNFIFLAVSEARVSHVVCWDVVINNEGCFYSVNKQRYEVDAGLVHFSGVEPGYDSLRVLGQSGKG